MVVSGQEKVRGKIIQDQRKVREYHLYGLFPYLELVSSNDLHKHLMSSQALTTIRSKRNKFIIRNQNKRKSILYLVFKFKNFNVNLLL